MIGNVAKESIFQNAFCFSVMVSPQLWSDAEQIVDHCQIFRSAEAYSAEMLHLICNDLVSLES